jgi:hypothetical protein
LATGTDVYLETGLLALSERVSFYEQVRGRDLAMRVCVVDAPREIRRTRVQERNHSANPYTQIVPAQFFEQASDAWQPPEAAERAAWNLVDI